MYWKHGWTRSDPLPVSRQSPPASPPLLLRVLLVAREGPVLRHPSLRTVRPSSGEGASLGCAAITSSRAGYEPWQHDASYRANDGVVHVSDQCLPPLALRNILRFPINPASPPSFPAIHASLLMAVEEQTQRCTHMGRAAESGHVGRINQDRTAQKEVPIPHTCTLSTTCMPATDNPKDDSAEPGMSQETVDPGRKVMSPATETCMNWRRQNQEDGIEMQAEKPYVHKSVHNVHIPFGRTNTQGRPSPGSPKAVIRGSSSKRISSWSCRLDNA
jgi:hypothetical protein